MKKNNLRISHLNTGSKGGAAIACQRLNLSLRARNINSLMLTKSKTTDLGEGQETCFNYFSELYLRIRMKFSNQKKTIQKNVSNYEIFTTPYTGYRLNWHRSIRASNIVHLHWISSFLDFESFFSRDLPKKIVWTIHDLNPFLGGLHYTLDRDRITSDLRSYENKLMHEKQNLIKGKGINFVFLSKWLYCEALTVAPWLNNEKVRFIANGIDTDVFSYQNRLSDAPELRLDPNKKNLLFISESVENYRKGFDLLLDALNEDFAMSQGINLIAIGRIPKVKLPHITYIGPINDFSLLAKYYNAVDGFVLPSRQDNLPNVMLEALCCGCPVVAFNTGGMSEHINLENGVLCQDITSNSLKEGILKLIANKYNRDEIALNSKAIFSSEISTDKYCSLYNEILGVDS